ncbi:MAG: hypothetical protein A49_12620 [Methyloceanibacter sp.]|nr:MAG: hypothetical protein A49_12620 [Methyloceanibacter sp.]
MSAAAQDSARPAGRDPGFLKRVWAMVVKEFVQMRRDRMTFATMLFIPILQLTLFGYAINTDPKHLPTAVLTRDDGPLTRAVLAAMKNSDYFAFTRQVRDPAELDAMLRSGAPNSPWRSRRVSSAMCGAATVRRCWSSPTPPIRLRRAPPSPPCRG